MNTRTTILLALALLLALPGLARAERFRLVSHTILSADGHLLSQARGDFAAWGTLDLEDGRVVVDITVTTTGGYRGAVAASGTFSVDSHGSTVHVDYENGTSHIGVVINHDPLVTLAYDDGYAEVNVWRPENPFERNQGGDTRE